MRRIAALGVAAALLATPAAVGDAGHEGGITMVVTPRDLMIDLSNPGHVPLDWELHNATGHALTIHGASSPRAERVTLIRRRKLLWLESWQPVDFLRLEGGETVALDPERYALSFQGMTETGMTLVLITLDLGPDGEVTLALVEPIGG